MDNIQCDTNRWEELNFDGDVDLQSVTMAFEERILDQQYTKQIFSDLNYKDFNSNSD